jgi:hypothetical protein
MARLNTQATARTAGRTPLTTATPVPTTRNHQGGAGYRMDEKTELFLMAVSSFHGEDSFYESAADRNWRFRTLMRAVTLADPEWVVRFLTWLRGPEANIRTAALVGAAEFVRARLSTGIREMQADGLDGQRGLNRQVLDAVCQRADEPAEILAYWMATYGRRVPAPVKRGLADAAQRLYTERNYLKWDSSARGVRMADVVELVHPTAKASWQGELFKHMLDVRHGNDDGVLPDSLSMLRARAGFAERARADKSILLDSEALSAAGMTWENALSLAGSDVDKAELWTAMIPSMGYMALLRNLRNFDVAGVSDAVAAQVAARLADPDEVARSRQLPFRFLSAYKAAPSLRWSQALDQALTHAVRNVPRLSGRTLILVDISASMNWAVSRQSTIRGQEQASIFGAALALNAQDATLVRFGSGSEEVPLRRGESLLRLVERVGGDMGGTSTVQAVQRHFRGHDRVVLISDQQAAHDWRPVSDVVPANVPLHAWDVGGYRFAGSPTGPNRHLYGGLSDASFKLVSLVEAGQSAGWPWEQ